MLLGENGSVKALLHVLSDLFVPVGKHRVDVEMLEVTIVK